MRKAMALVSLKGWNKVDQEPQDFIYLAVILVEMFSKNIYQYTVKKGKIWQY